MSLEVLETNSTAYACSIEPYLSSDDQALSPVASAHGMLVTHDSVWLGWLPIAIGGLFSNVTNLVEYIRNGGILS